MSDPYREHSEEIGESLKRIRSFTPAGGPESEELDRLEDLIAGFMVELSIELAGLPQVIEDLVRRAEVDRESRDNWKMKYSREER
jgi:hypothetical protein